MAPFNTEASEVFEVLMAEICQLHKNGPLIKKFLEHLNGNL